jgi:hypothetical protein
MPFPNITYSEEEKYIKHLKLPESWYQIMKIMLQIMKLIDKNFLNDQEKVNPFISDKFTIIYDELLINCDFIEKQLYSSVFGSEQDRINKLLRRINNQILAIKSFFSLDLSHLLWDPSASETAVEFVNSQLQLAKHRKEKILQLLEKIKPDKDKVREMEKTVEIIEEMMVEDNKKEITYEQIGELYTYWNGEPLDSSQISSKFDETCDIELGLHSSQYQKILTFLSNFLMPPLNGLMITGIKHSNTTLKNFYSRCITYPLKNLHFSATSRLKVSLEEYISVTSKVTQKACFGWFYIYLRDFEELMKAAMGIAELILERWKIYIPKNTILAMSEADKTYFNEIQDSQIDLQFENDSQLEILNFYDVLFTEEAFRDLIKAINLSPIGQSLKELRLHRLGIPKDNVFQMTWDWKYKVVF